MTSLNPLLSVGFQISEVLRKHRKFSRSAAKKMAIELLEKVGIPKAKNVIMIFLGCILAECANGWLLQLR
nr:hypothetical protein [Spiroplasma poulsonii]